MFDPREDLATVARVLRARAPEISAARRSLAHADLLTVDERERYEDAEYLLHQVADLIDPPPATSARAA